MAHAIGTLAADTALRDRLAESGRRFAREHCMEENAVGYFSRYLATQP